MLAQWNVKTTTKKRVLISGTAVHYKFKFNMSSKQTDAGKNFTKLRDERLRAQAE